MAVLITAVVTTLVVGGGLAAVYFLVLDKGTPMLNTGQVQGQVGSILMNDFGVSLDDGSVKCPASMKAEAGQKYVCDYSSNGQAAQVQVTVLNESQYLVGSVGEASPPAIQDPLVEDNDINGAGWKIYDPATDETE
ncbi:MAG: DUF4333 domain-containing protein [Bifidobacteriaceae bacterium]|nr:DUF4333 domain-containing protein [Bifidobacteriaceae bacterium]